MSTRSRTIIYCIALTTFLTVGWLVVRERPATASASAAGLTPSQQTLELTVYSHDFGLVHEARTVRLAAGANHLRFADVSRELDPESVLLGFGPGARAQIVSHAYDLGASSPDGLLKRFVGRQVDVVRYGMDGRESERLSGTLVVQANGDTVLQSGDRFYVRPPGSIVTPAAPDLAAVPQLTVQAQSQTAQSASLDIAYLTRGLSWSPDYVATLSPTGSTLHFDCYATVTNRTGADFPNARVALVAGTPNRAVETARQEIAAKLAFGDGHARWLPGAPASVMVGGPDASDHWYESRSSGRAAASPEEVGDLYTYPSTAPTTVAQEQMNRLLILGASSVPMKRDYSTHPPLLGCYNAWDYGWQTDGRTSRGSVQAAMSFYNRRSSGLGQPLPEGTVRMYEPDAHGSLRYAGAATVPATPKDAKVDLTLARAFDLYTNQRTVKLQQINRHSTRKSVQVVVHNDKAVPATVRVVQSFGGRWKVVRESGPHANLDAYTAQWSVTVPAGSAVPLDYAVDLTE